MSDPYAAHLGSRLMKWQANVRNPCKSPAVRAYVEEKLRADWSPEEIAGRIALNFPQDPTMRISHETIYQYANRDTLFVAHATREAQARASEVPPHGSDRDARLWPCDLDQPASSHRPYPSALW